MLFRLLTQLRSRKAAVLNVLNHNQIDAAVMTRLAGASVARKDFTLEEDRTKTLAPGVSWRRRRFRFYFVADEEQKDPAGLCVNEITIDSNAEGELRPTLAAEYAYLMDFDPIENAYWQTNWATGAIRGGRGTKESRLFLNVAPLLQGADENTPDLLARLERLQTLGQYSDDAAGEAEVFDPVYAEYPAGNFAVARYLPAFPPSHLVQSSENILAATNAGYFLNFPEEYQDGISALHQPVGGHMADGNLVAPPWIERPGILGFAEGGVRADLYGPEHLELLIGDATPLALHRWEHGTAQHGAVVRHFDSFAGPVADGIAQIVFCGPTVVRVERSATLAAPPLGGATVLVGGDHAAAPLQPHARQVAVRLRAFAEGTPRWMICAGPFLVRDGGAVGGDRMLTPEFAGEFRKGGPAPTRFPYDTDKTAAPRTAVGITAAGGVKLVVADGRSSREHSIGLTLSGLAALMENVGCDAAINLDGGGSSVLCIEGAENADLLRENLTHGVVNIPSDDGNRERIVPVILMVQKKSGR